MERNSKAFSQLLWSGKSSEVWFSLRENHVKVSGFPVFPATQHWPGTLMCDFPQRKSHAVRWLHQHPQEIRVRSTPIAQILQLLATRYLAIKSPGALSPEVRLFHDSAGKHGREPYLSG